MTTARPIGIAGLGLLGSALAHRLLGAGYSPKGFDIDAAKAATFAKAGGTAASLDQVAHCDVVLLAVFDTSQVEHVVTNAAPTALAVMGLQLGYLLGGSIPIASHQARTANSLSSLDFIGPLLHLTVMVSRRNVPRMNFFVTLIIPPLKVWLES